MNLHCRILIRYTSKVMSSEPETKIEEIQANFNAFYTDPGNYEAFYTWRSDLELYLKRDPGYIQENEDFYSKFFPAVQSQLDLVPTRWNAETVSLRMRLSWLLEDIKSLSTPSLSKFTQAPQQVDSIAEQKVYEVEEGYLKSPQVALSSHWGVRPTGIKEFIQDKNLTARTRFRKCETSQDYENLSGVLLEEFFDTVERHDPDEILVFLKESGPIFQSLMMKVENIDLFIALLDIFPYFLFHGHRAPYDNRYIDCARLLTETLHELLSNPKINFKGRDSEYLDDSFHYLFHSLFYFLEQGRLLAFEDCFRITLGLLENSERLHLRYYYLPLIPELYYWIPEAYMDKLHGFVLKEIHTRIRKMPDSPLRQLLYLVNVESTGHFDERIVISEFLKEVYKDRKIAESERRIIRDLLTQLKFPALEYRKILREVFRELRRNKFQESGELDRRSLIEKLIRIASVDGKLSDHHNPLLLTAAKCLSISPTQFKSIHESVKNAQLTDSVVAEKGLRRLGWGNVSLTLLKSLEWYKWKQMKLEDFQRLFSHHMKNRPYHPESNHFYLEGDPEKAFQPLTGEVKITAFEKSAINSEEIAILVYSTRDMLRKWFEIANQIEYLIFDYTLRTFSLDLYLMNMNGRILVTSDLPIQNPDTLREVLKQREGRCRLFIVEEGSRKIVHWQHSTSYLIEKKKVEPLLDALQTRNFTSIKVISQIGQKKDPSEILYYHAMIENVLFLASNQDDCQEMISLCHELLKSKFKDDFKLLYYLGYLYFEVGQMEKGYKWLEASISKKPDYREALLLYCEKKSSDDVLNPQCLGYMKYLDLSYPGDERLNQLFRRIENKHSIPIKSLLSRSRIMIHSNTPSMS